MLYTVIALVIAMMAAVWGFRKGLARQLPSLLGTAFGILASRLLAPGLLGVIDGAFPSAHGRPEEAFVYFTLATAIVFFSIYFIFRAVTGFLGKVFSRDDRSILDNLGGSVFAIFKYMLFVSIAYNLLVAINPSSELVRSARSDDGNTVFEVMLLAPAMLGGPDIEDLALKLQLEDAKHISCAGKPFLPEKCCIFVE